jgi:hypothetical protein
VTILGASIAALGFLMSYFWAQIWFYYFAIGIVGGMCLRKTYLLIVDLYFQRPGFWINLFTSYCLCWILF